MGVIEARELTKEYEDGTGIDSLTFSVSEGEVFGLLGPQGSGKTTAIRTVLGIQYPTAGEATVLGHDTQSEGDLRRAKADIGYLPASPAFDENASGVEILDSHGTIRGDDRREELVERFDLPVSRRVRDYSTENVQKLALVGAFMHDPALVFMDEPLSGLEPSVKQQFNEFIRAEQRCGVTVFFASETLSEVRRLCDRVGILWNGRLLAIEPAESLLHRNGKVVHLRIAEAVDASVFEFEGVHDLDVRTVSVGSGPKATVAGPGGGSPLRSATTVTEAVFTFIGDVNTLIETVSAYPLLEFDLEEAPLETVLGRLYGDATDG